MSCRKLLRQEAVIWQKAINPARYATEVAPLEGESSGDITKPPFLCDTEAKLGIFTDAQGLVEQAHVLNHCTSDNRGRWQNWSIMNKVISQLIWTCRIETAYRNDASVGCVVPAEINEVTIYKADVASARKGRELEL